MDTLERFNAALTYIEANLDNEIDSRELSKITLYSAYQFQKLFMAMSGIPLSEYIRNRRLDRAAFDLQNTDEKIADIACKYGYDSPTAFNRAFQKLHGVAPSKVRTEKGIQLKAYPPIQFQICIKGATVMKYRSVVDVYGLLLGYRRKYVCGSTRLYCFCFYLWKRNVLRKDKRFAAVFEKNQ